MIVVLEDLRCKQRVKQELSSLEHDFVENTGIERGAYWCQEVYIDTLLYLSFERFFECEMRIT